MVGVFAAGLSLDVHLLSTTVLRTRSKESAEYEWQWSSLELSVVLAVTFRGI